jgi:hypothetical protein
MLAAHESSCGWEAHDLDWTCGDRATSWRAVAFRVFSQCAIDLPCSEDTGTCVQKAFDAVRPLAYHEDYELACLARVPECHASGAGCTADEWALYSSDTMAALTACEELPCAEILDCKLMVF